MVSCMNFESISEKIISFKNNDIALRNKLMQAGELDGGYNKKMEDLHNCNAKALNQIIDKIGYPTKDKVGNEASEAAWLVIQHAISQPRFMKTCVKLLEEAVKEQKVNPKNLAYLTDRVAVLEGNPQRFGTQFDWDNNGEMSPNPFDDLAKMNQRRKAIGLNPLEEQIEIMRQWVKNEERSAPKDLEKRKMEYDAWRKKVGWY